LRDFAPLTESEPAGDRTKWSYTYIPLGKTGDSDPDDGKLSTFYNPVFATPYFGYARDIQPFNLIHLQPNVAYRLGDKLVVTLLNGLYWRASKDDAFYGKLNGITARAGTSDS
jgi:hypothetical protein